MPEDARIRNNDGRVKGVSSSISNYLALLDMLNNMVVPCFFVMFWAWITRVSELQYRRDGDSILNWTVSILVLNIPPKTEYSKNLNKKLKIKKPVKNI